MEEDLILGDEIEDDEDYKPNALAVIEKQLDVISYVSELDNSVYDECLEDKIKVITRALKLIYKIQGNILKDF